MPSSNRSICVRLIQSYNTLLSPEQEVQKCTCHLQMPSELTLSFPQPTPHALLPIQTYALPPTYLHIQLVCFLINSNRFAVPWERVAVIKYLKNKDLCRIISRKSTRKATDSARHRRSFPFLGIQIPLKYEQSITRYPLKCACLWSVCSTEA